jgi:hypothetical protein
MIIQPLRKFCSLSHLYFRSDPEGQRFMRNAIAKMNQRSQCGFVGRWRSQTWPLERSGLFQ